MGDDYSVAWRTLDAQYWGVAQRRKRIYLVADFTGRRAGKILFKPESLPRNMQTGNEAGQGATADAVGSVDGSSGNGGQLAATVISSYGTKWNGNAGAYNGENFVLQKHSVDGSVGVECIAFAADKASTLRAGAGAPKHMADILGRLVVLNDQGGSSINVESEEISPTLRANSHQHEPVIALQANGIDRADTAGCNGAGWRENESYTLNTVDRHAVCYGIDHVITTGGNCTAQGPCVYEDTQATLKAGGVHAVCYQGQVGALQARDYKGVGSQYVGEDKLVVECYDARGNGDGETACTITGDHQNRITDYTAVAVQETLCFNEGQITSPTNGNNPQWNEPCHTLSATDSRAPTVIFKKPPRKYIIRRLTPTECARLQGFPDFWGQLAPYNPADAEFWEDVRKTHAEINGKKYKPVKDIKKWYDKLHTDSAEYRMWGNGIALPNARYVLRGIAEHGAKTLGSLFDGSGGFPLAGVLNGIKPLWASEIEPYPIAVTKSRFREVHNGK